MKHRKHIPNEDLTLAHIHNFLHVIFDEIKELKKIMVATQADVDALTQEVGDIKSAVTAAVQKFEDEIKALEDAQNTGNSIDLTNLKSGLDDLKASVTPATPPSGDGSTGSSDESDTNTGSTGTDSGDAGSSGSDSSTGSDATTDPNADANAAGRPAKV